MSNQELSGDHQLLRNPYRSLAFMLCSDHAALENGSESKAQKMFELCEEYD